MANDNGPTILTDLAEDIEQTYQKYSVKGKQLKPTLSLEGQNVVDNLFAIIQEMRDKVQTLAQGAKHDQTEKTQS